MIILMVVILSICAAFFYWPPGALFQSLHRELYQYGRAALSHVINTYLIWRYPIRSLDGTQGIPTCPYQWPNGQGDVAKFLEGEKNSGIWGKQHGQVYRIWSGTTPEMRVPHVLTHPEDVQTVFHDSDKHAKAINNNSGWLMGELLGKCVGLISGAEWRKVRNETAPHFHHKRTASYMSRIEEITKRHFDELHSKGRLDQGKLNPVDDLRYLPFWGLADILYGELSPDMTAQLMKIVAIRESLWNRMIQGGWTRHAWGRYLSIKTDRDLHDFKQRWADFNTRACTACRSARREAAVVDMYSAVTEGKMTLDQLLQTLDEMLFANLDVTMGGISWSLMFLAANPSIQTELRHEIRAALAKDATGTQSRHQYLQSSSTLLAASIMESARLRPLAAFSVPQSAPTARIIRGFMVPAGTNFIVDTYSLNIKNPYWGKDSETYRPARFLEDTVSRMRYQYWRFGFGPRQCMGKYVADMMIRVLLVHLVENYELSLDANTPWEKNPSTWIQHPNTDIGCCRVANAGEMISLGD